MRTQLFFDLTAEGNHHRFIHFREADEIDCIVDELRANDHAIFEADGAGIHSLEDLLRVLSLALRKPEGWFGDEVFAPNSNAFMEYLDDVRGWVPAKGHIVLLRGATALWANHPRLAGNLTEWWQFSTINREAAVHLVFVW
jgi:hypothetical protein